MIVIHIARKPLDGTVAKTALEHGTGGLNVDKSRVGAFKAHTPSGMDRYNATLFEKGYRPSAYQRGKPEVPSTEGRWPANLILEHRLGCRRVGTTQEEVPINTWDEGTKPFGGGAGLDYTSKVSTVTTSVWECVEDCPCRQLDKKSGDSVSGAMKREVESYAGESLISFIRGRSGPSNQHGGKGGASRFFKQVGERTTKRSGDVSE